MDVCTHKLWGIPNLCMAGIHTLYTISPTRTPPLAQHGPAANLPGCGALGWKHLYSTRNIMKLPPLINLIFVKKFLFCLRFRIGVAESL
jgi:hypothetical protein